MDSQREASKDISGCRHSLGKLFYFYVKQISSPSLLQVNLNRGVYLFIFS